MGKEMTLFLVSCESYKHARNCCIDTGLVLIYYFCFPDGVASPDADIDALAIKAYRERLREEQRERALARAEKEQQQYETEALNTGDMQGEDWVMICN